MCAFWARSTGNCSNKESSLGCANCEAADQLRRLLQGSRSDRVLVSTSWLQSFMTFFLDYSYWNNWLSANTCTVFNWIMKSLALNLLLIRTFMKSALFCCCYDSKDQWRSCIVAQHPKCLVLISHINLVKNPQKSSDRRSKTERVIGPTVRPPLWSRPQVSLWKRRPDLAETAAVVAFTLISVAAVSSSLWFFCVVSRGRWKQSPLALLPLDVQRKLSDCGVVDWRFAKMCDLDSQPIPSPWSLASWFALSKFEVCSGIIGKREWKPVQPSGVETLVVRTFLSLHIPEWLTC